MKDKRPLIIFGIAAILLLVVFLYIMGGGRRFDWSENYKDDNKDPYGAYIVHSLLKDYYPDRKFTDISKSIHEELPVDSNETKATYVFVGEGLYMDTADVDQLLTFVEKGNKAFISSKSIPFDLMFYVYYEECNDYYWDDYLSVNDSLGSFNMIHEKLKSPNELDFKYIVKGNTKSYDWNYIDSVYFCEQDFSFIRLGTVNKDYVNFAKIKYGEGEFYFHTNPIAFSNIQLLDETGISYANKVFSHLEEGPIYWDNYSRVREAVSRRRNQSQNYNTDRGLSSEGPLKYILGQAPLAWAWYLLLSSALLYLLFRAKRKQRIIPVYEGNKNTSLEFISTIGSLYFLQNDHKKLCEQKMKFFLGHVRDRYNIATKEIDKVFVEKLSAKSEVPETLINSILKYYKNIDNGTLVTDHTLIDFHQVLEKFYKNRK
ncbi:MAG: hypothetical protein ACI81W_001994 [Saprospiraceae bacterium]|jgi:hypothetical protein